MPGGGVVHAPADWIGEWAELPAGLDPRELAAALVRVGLEVEKVETAGDALSGPIVVGRVLSADLFPSTNTCHRFRAGDRNTMKADPDGSICNGTCVCPLADS